MQLSQISTVVRPRSSWQAIDLGCKMAAQWFKPLVLGYLTLTLPVFCLLLLVFKNANPYYVFFALWWLKPLWERILLGYLSVRQFGQFPSLKQQLHNWWQVAFRQLLPSLLWRRFSPRRSYSMPVVQLEQLSGQKRNKRMMLFAGENQQAAFWLTTVGQSIEFSLTFGMLFLLSMLIPTEANIAFDIFTAKEDHDYLTVALSYLSIVLVAPFYVASGFALYLNQRTQIESWDIEITFRRMLQRRTEKATPAVAIVALLLLFGSIYPQPSFSAVETDTPVNTTTVRLLDSELPTELQAQISAYKAIRLEARTIVAGEPFNHKEMREYPKFYLDFTFDPEQQETEPVTAKWLIALIRFISASFEWLLVSLLVALIIFLLIRYRQTLFGLVAPSKPNETFEPVINLFGLDIAKQDLPDDPAASARALWYEGEKRQAMSLLYRGALFVLVSRRHLIVGNSFTEGECLQQVKMNTPLAVYELFAQITQYWQQLAYAGKFPDDRAMDELFNHWPLLFASSKDDN